MRGRVAVLGIVVGVGLVIFPIAYSMVDRTADAERILDRFEFLTLGDNPARYLGEAEVTRAGSAELVDKAIPKLAADAGLSAGELDRLAATMFPALTTAAEEIAQANEFSARYSEQLAAVDEKFQSVYDIPISAVPLTATPWLFLVGGLACLAAGLIALRTTGRGPTVAILTLGAAMLVGPLVLSGPGKSADGEDVKDFASRGLTATAATAAQQASAALDALVEETGEEIIPFLAARQGIPPAQLEGRLGSEFPAAERFLSEWAVIGPRLGQLADAVSASVDEFESAKQLPIAFPVWLLLAAGAVMIAAAGVALAPARYGPSVTWIGRQQ
ncbi:MAG: hypothetical protein ACR2G3_00590 [Solirubrobacterales bacterium]